ncbi:uncharacterized protein LY79DRAFT_552751 [Colletotrichum navitas]|uniref:Uncharacterized protein n=1 Tax=Colletotrichum navitas TaxID=681940 RepID=A0AAD8V506_9PEZI|nr:uncharacterized protein LY79DRAFT_552751 [Colletotrichum navitas]KAK1593104.1 hypothetical protein LY79DRAFT_552751 [Colletotrichum navitas]
MNHIGRAMSRTNKRNSYYDAQHPRPLEASSNNIECCFALFAFPARSSLAACGEEAQRGPFFSPSNQTPSVQCSRSFYPFRSRISCSANSRMGGRGLGHRRSSETRRGDACRTKLFRCRRFSCRLSTARQRQSKDKWYLAQGFVQGCMPI